MTQNQRVADDDEPTDEHMDSMEAMEAMHARLHRIERLLEPERRLIGGAIEGAEQHVLTPAWRRVTEGEPRWQVSLGVIAAIAIQLSLPSEVVIGTRWILPVLAGLLLVGLIVGEPMRLNRESRVLRAGSMVLIIVMSTANAGSAARLVTHLVRGTNHQDPASLLLTGAAIWVVNVIVFSLWYWELDRGGPVARAHDMRHGRFDFVFTQMQLPPELAPMDWEPMFVDYLYLSFTNATAFSPTDTLPLSRWAKLTMMLQSAVSLLTVALVIARAVNVLK